MKDEYEVIKNYLYEDEQVVFTGSWQECKDKADELQSKAQKEKSFNKYGVYYIEGNYGDIIAD